MAGRLEGKVSIVTGAGRGIGRAIALRFADEGAAVVAVQRTLAEGEQVVAEIELVGGRAFAVSTDVADPDSVEDMVAQTLETYGRVDVLCNNAGIGGVQNLLELTMERYDRVMDTNVRGLLLCMKYAIKPMVEQSDGSIINVGSITSFVGLPESIIYCASKGAVLNLTRQASLDWASKGVRVNLVAPGFIQTPLTDSYFDVQPDPEKARADVMRVIPAGRIGTPEDVAGAAVYFASDDSRWVTGAQLVVDGGTLCH